MRISLFAPGSFPAATGAIVYDSKLAAALRELGHDCDLVMVGGQHPEADAAARASAASLWAAHASDDLRIIDGFCLAAWEGAEAALSGPGIVGLIHHPMALEPQQEAGKTARFAAIERSLLPRFGTLLMPSLEMKRRLRGAYPLDAARLSILVPGFEGAPERHQPVPGRCNLLALGSLIRRKGQDLLLKALGRLVDLDWHLTLCGDMTAEPDYVVTLRALVAELGLAERVTILPPQHGAALEALWRDCDLFALPTWFEGYGMAIVDALRRGIPVATTSAAAVGAPLSAETAAIVEPGDHTQLSKALRRMIYSEVLRQAMGDSAWAATRALPSWADQARHLLEIVQTATKIRAA